MSRRTTSSRQNGDGRFVPITIAAPFLIPEPAALVRVGVQSTPGSTVDIKVNGASIRAQCDHPTGVVAAASFVAFSFGSYPLNAGDELTVTSTDAAALVTASFREA